MPVLKDAKVEAGKITKDDVVKGRTAAVVKIGTKFAEVRDAEGKMILRARFGAAAPEDCGSAEGRALQHPQS